MAMLATDTQKASDLGSVLKFTVGQPALQNMRNFSDSLQSYSVLEREKSQAGLSTPVCLLPHPHPQAIVW